MDKLEVVCEATAAGWIAAQRFMELKECLRGDVIKSYKRLAADNYPNPADKTNANYEELVHLIPADSRDRLYP